MEQMEVKNKETTIPNQNEFNDKDMLTDVLSSLKSLSTLYGTCLQESSNDDLYQAIEDEANKVANNIIKLALETNTVEKPKNAEATTIIIAATIAHVFLSSFTFSRAIFFLNAISTTLTLFSLMSSLYLTAM